MRVRREDLDAVPGHGAPRSSPAPLDSIPPPLLVSRMRCAASRARSGSSRSGAAVRSLRRSASARRSASSASSQARRAVALSPLMRHAQLSYFREPRRHGDLEALLGEPRRAVEVARAAGRAGPGSRSNASRSATSSSARAADAGRCDATSSSASAAAREIAPRDAVRRPRCSRMKAARSAPVLWPARDERPVASYDRSDSVDAPRRSRRSRCWSHPIVFRKRVMKASSPIRSASARPSVERARALRRTRPMSCARSALVPEAPDAAG